MITFGQADGDIDFPGDLQTMNINQLTFFFQINTLASHTFLPHLIGNKPTIVDLGGNRGDFYREISRRFDIRRYIAIEPNSNLTGWAVGDPKIELRHYALTQTDGPVQFGVDENPEASRVATASAANNITVEGRSFASIIAELKIDRIDLLKMDIEGSEIDLIMQTPADLLQRIGQITLEFHDFCNFSTPVQVQDAIAHLEKSGFSGIQFSRDNSNWCFVRKDNPRFSTLKFLAARHVAAPVRRTKHWLQQLF